MQYKNNFLSVVLFIFRRYAQKNILGKNVNVPLAQGRSGGYRLLKRHPGAGWDLVINVFWIPACAGMTALWILYVFFRKGFR